MKTLLQNKNTRKIFLVTIVVILIFVLIVRFFVLPQFEPVALPSCAVPKDPKWLSIITRLLDSLFVSLTVTVSIGLFLFYIEIPEEEKKFEIVEPFKLAEIFNKERNQTESWHFSGGLGRFARSETIPKLAKSSKATNQHKIIKIQVLDPSNEDVCSSYANYRRNLNSASKTPGVWTRDFVKLESLSTIITALWYKDHYSLLDISIHIKNNFSTLRIDLSDNAAIVTKEDDKEPALVCKNGSFLYRSYKEELLQTSKEYKSVSCFNILSYNLDSITANNVRETVSALNIKLNLLDEDYIKIAGIIKENKNPYA